MEATRIVHVEHQRCELQAYQRPDTEAAQIAGPTLVSLVSPGTELHANYGGSRFPNHSGYAAIFRAEDIGAEVTDVTPGELYFCAGNHGSWQRCAAADAVPVPAGLAPEHAVLARLMGVSHTSLITTAARPGDRVLVTGLGPVGYLAAVQAGIAGYEVLACDPIAERRALAEAAGIAVAEAPPADWGAALALECSGHEDAVIACCHAVRRLGEVSLIGVPWVKRSDALAHELLHAVFHRYVQLRSGWEWAVPRRSEHFSDLHSIRSGFETCLRWLAADRVPLPAGLIGRCDPADCDAVYRGHLERSLDHLCSVFTWQSAPVPA